MYKQILMGLIFLGHLCTGFASNNTTLETVCPGRTSLYCHLNPTDLLSGEHNIVYSCMSINQLANDNNVHYLVKDGMCPLVEVPPEENRSTESSANHVVDIFMGGFEDGLYVCGVEIVGHQCDLDDTNENGDFLEVDGRNVGNHFEWAPPVLTTTGTTDLGKTTELHLNSFRFGTIYKVKYCYDYERVTSGTGIVISGQEGRLSGNFEAIVANSGLAGNYVNLADISAELSYECEDYLGPVNMDNQTFYPFNENTSNSLEVSGIFNLGSTGTGKCWFEAKFIEGNIGKIRPINQNAANGVTTGRIQTTLDLKMDLIQN